MTTLLWTILIIVAVIAIAIIAFFWWLSRAIDFTVDWEDDYEDVFIEPQDIIIIRAVMDSLVQEPGVLSEEDSESAKTEVWKISDLDYKPLAGQFIDTIGKYQSMNWSKFFNYLTGIQEDSKKASQTEGLPQADRHALRIHKFVYAAISDEMKERGVG